MSQSVIQESKADYHRAQTGGVSTKLISGQKAIYVADKVIIRDDNRDEDDEDLSEEQKLERQKLRKAENDKYFMGYFKWYWKKCNSFFLTYMHFSGRSFWFRLRWSFFSGIGLAIGSFIAI